MDKFNQFDPLIKLNSRSHLRGVLRKCFLNFAEGLVKPVDTVLTISRLSPVKCSKPMTKQIIKPLRAAYAGAVEQPDNLRGFFVFLDFLAAGFGLSVA